MLDSAELYDPTTDTWTRSGSLHQGRSGHTATLLQNGKVLVAGGYDGVSSVLPSDLDSAELYDPATGTWSVTGSLNRRRSSHTAVLLQDGRVLIVDGNTSGYCPCGAPSELYDPATGQWSLTTNTKNLYSSLDHPSTLLASGEVLVEGGDDGVDGAVAQAELYDPRTGLWSDTAWLNTGRGAHTATLLTNGQVLVAGGGDVGVFSSAELYTAPIAIDASFTGSWFDPAQSGHGLMLEVLPDNRLLALWFAFDPAGDQQSWFGGVGTYSGNTATITDVALPTGGRWIPNFNPNTIVRNPWGTLTFTFTDHDHGKVDFNSGARLRQRQHEPVAPDERGDTIRRRHLDRLSGCGDNGRVRQCVLQQQPEPGFQTRHARHAHAHRRSWRSRILGRRRSGHASATQLSPFLSRTGKRSARLFRTGWRVGDRRCRQRLYRRRVQQSRSQDCCERNHYNRCRQRHRRQFRRRRDSDQRCNPLASGCRNRRCRQSVCLDGVCQSAKNHAGRNHPLSDGKQLRRWLSRPRSVRPRRDRRRRRQQCLCRGWLIAG